MKKKSSSYQYFTDRIAEKAGAQNEYRAYYDPIYRSQLFGSFLRGLYKLPTRPYLKILFGFFYFVLPVAVSGFYLYATKAYQHQATPEKLFNILLYGIFYILYAFIGMKFIVRGLKDTKKKSH